MSHINIVEEKKNFITVSDYTQIHGGMLNQFTEKSEIYWKVIPPDPTTLIERWEEWIKVNGILKSRLVGVDFTVLGSFEEFVIETSLDDHTWREVYRGDTLPVGGFYVTEEDRHSHQQGAGHVSTGEGIGVGHDQGVEFRFLRVRFIQNTTALEMTNLDIIAELSLDEDDLYAVMSDFAELMVPEQIDAQDPLLKDLIKTYLNMLETNLLEIFTKIHPNVAFAINVDLVREGGAIDFHPIDSIPINYG